jgi:hypothetical protein
MKIILISVIKRANGRRNTFLYGVYIYYTEKNKKESKQSLL